MSFANTVTFVAYSNSGTATGIYRYPEDVANNVIVEMGILRFEFVDNDEYASISVVPPISSLLESMPIQNAIVTTITETPGGNTVANAAWFFQIPANATVLVDQTFITDEVAYSNANVVVANTNLGPAGYYVAVEPEAEDGVYQLKFSHPDYDDFLAQVTCAGATITVDWTS